jgi:hypothetical protein
MQILPLDASAVGSLAAPTSKTALKRFPVELLPRLSSSLSSTLGEFLTEIRPERS